MSHMSTIFKKIIDREIPADIVYEDADILAFLDISPIRKGHTLIIPKKECVNILDADAETLSKMITVAQKVAQALTKTVGAAGINLHMNNGHEAGQDVFHAHMHIIPRFEKGETFIIPNHEKYTDNESSELAQKIKATII